MQLNRILRYIVLGGIFILPVIPFILVNSMFFPFITGKNFFFRIVVDLVFGAWLLLALRDVSYRPKRTWILYAFSAFVLVMAAANIFGENPGRSMWSNFERMEGYVTILHLFGYFLVVSSVLSYEKLWKRLWNTTLGVSVLISFFAIFQISGFFAINQGGNRIDATFGNATYLAIYLLFHIFISLMLLFKWRGGVWAKYLYGAIALLEIYLLFQTGTRGAMLGLLGGLLLSGILVAWKEREHKVLRKVAIGTVLTVVVLTGLFFAIKDSNFAKDSLPLKRLNSISLNDRTAQSRFTIWGMAVEGFWENPILGTGQENFNILFNKYYKPSLYNQEPWFDRAHNVVIDWLTAGGILGLLTYLSLFGSVLYLMWKKSSPLSVVEKSIFTGMLAGYFFHNLFVFDNVVSYIMFVMVLAYIHSKTANNDSAKPIIEGVPKSGVQGALATLIIIFTVWSLYFFSVPGILTSKSLINALRPNEAGYDQNIASYRKALSYGILGKQEIREQLIRDSQAIANRADISVELKQEMFTLALQEMGTQTEEASKDARTQLFTGDFLNRFGQFVIAQPFLDRAHTLSPGKQNMLFALADNATGLGNIDEAVEFARQAFELDTSYGTARTYYASMLIRVGREEEAEALLEEGFGDTAVTDSVLINAYADANNYLAVIELWKARVEQAPSDVQARISLAASYLKQGNQIVAIAILEQASIDIPDFAPQANSIIEQIRAGTLQ